MPRQTKVSDADLSMKHVGFRPDSLRWLVCPVCRAELVLAEDRLAEAREDADQRIACRGCARTYPVVDGIPVLLRGD